MHNWFWDQWFGGVGVGGVEHVLNWVGRPRESIGNRFFIARLRKEAGGNSCHLILLQFGDPVSVPGRQVGNVSLTVPWHLLHPSKYTWAKLSLSKVVHKLLEKSIKARIMYINTLTLTFQMTRPGNLNRC